MQRQDITFDRFVRGLILLSIVIFSFFIIKSLSGVLLPFAVAWLLSYLFYPIVLFFQQRLRLRYRFLSIVALLSILLLLLLSIFVLVVPSIYEEIMLLKKIAIDFVTPQTENPTIPSAIGDFLRQYANENGLAHLLQNSSVQELARQLAEKTWMLAMGTINVVIQIFASCITLLYLFFILLDYEKLAEWWKTLLPRKLHKPASALIRDISGGMNQYFRGQALIALCVGLLLSIGFLIIGFPMAIGFGLFIGFLNLVPYLQIVSLIPMLLLSLLQAASTGDNFWVILFSAVSVLMIVQLIQDIILTPRIMGKRMNLHPAVILLSLSVWGKLLGLVGMIIALPLTSLLLAYLKRYYRFNSLKSPKSGE